MSVKHKRISTEAAGFVVKETERQFLMICISRNALKLTTGEAAYWSSLYMEPAFVDYNKTECFCFAVCQTDAVHRAVNGFDDGLFIEVFLCATAAAWLKLTVLVAMFVDLDPLYLKEVLVYADTVKIILLLITLNWFSLNSFWCFGWWLVFVLESYS